LVGQVQQLQSRLCQDADRYPEGVAQKLRGRGLQVRGEVVEDQPASAILHEAEREKAGMIADATHARSGLTRMLLGSVADKDIRGAQALGRVYPRRRGRDRGPRVVNFSSRCPFLPVTDYRRLTLRPPVSNPKSPCVRLCPRLRGWQKWLRNCSPSKKVF